MDSSNAVIEYVIKENPDSRILDKASVIVEKGGIICFPSETNWLLACSPFHKEAIKKIYELKKLNPLKHLTILCTDFSKAESLAIIENSAFHLIKKVTPGPYTFIFQAQKIMRKHLKASKTDHEVGIKFSADSLCKKIVHACDGQLLSTHLNYQMMGVEEKDYPLYGALIEEYFRHKIDLIIDPGEVEFLGPSTIIDFTQGPPVILREGSGSLDIFKKTQP